MNTRFAPVSFFVALVLAFAPVASAAELFLGIEVERIERIIDLGYNHDSSMVAEIERLATDFPKSPVPGLLDSGRMYWIRDYAEVDEDLDDVFEEVIKKSIAKAKGYLKRHKGDAQAELVLAMIQILEVKYLVDKGRYLTVFWRQRAPMKTMKNLMKVHPEYHDAKMIIGMANCYLSKAPSYLKPLAMLMRFDGDMDVGLKYLSEAKEYGLFTRVDSAYYISMVQTELLNDAETAYEKLIELAERYPKNLRFQLLLAQMEHRKKQHVQANERSKKILESPDIERFVGLKMRALDNQYWSALQSQRYEKALTACEVAMDFISGDSRFQGWLPWTKNAKAETLKQMGRRDEAALIFKSVTRENKGAYEFAQGRLEETQQG